MRGDLTATELLGEMGFDARDWKDMLRSIAAAMQGEMRPWLDTDAQELIDAIEATGAVDARGLFLDTQVEALLGEARHEAVCFGVLLGYGLARCWPDGPEGLDKWPTRAAALVGLEATPDAGPPAAWLDARQRRRDQRRGRAA